jgi:hypothetical protein
MMTMSPAELVSRYCRLEVEQSSCAGIGFTVAAKVRRPTTATARFTSPVHIHFFIHCSHIRSKFFVLDESPR